MSSSASKNNPPHGASKTHAPKPAPAAQQPVLQQQQQQQQVEQSQGVAKGYDPHAKLRSALQGKFYETMQIEPANVTASKSSKVTITGIVVSTFPYQEKNGVPGSSVAVSLVITNVFAHENIPTLDYSPSGNAITIPLQARKKDGPHVAAFAKHKKVTLMAGMTLKVGTYASNAKDPKVAVVESLRLSELHPIAVIGITANAFLNNNTGTIDIGFNADGFEKINCDLYKQPMGVLLYLASLPQTIYPEPIPLITTTLAEDICEDHFMARGGADADPSDAAPGAGATLTEAQQAEIDKKKNEARKQQQKERNAIYGAIIRREPIVSGYPNTVLMRFGKQRGYEEELLRKVTGDADAFWKTFIVPPTHDPSGKASDDFWQRREKDGVKTQKMILYHKLVSTMFAKIQPTKNSEPRYVKRCYEIVLTVLREFGTRKGYLFLSHILGSCSHHAWAVIPYHIEHMDLFVAGFLAKPETGNEQFNDDDIRPCYSVSLMASSIWSNLASHVLNRGIPLSVETFADMMLKRWAPINQAGAPASANQNHVPIVTVERNDNGLVESMSINIDAEILADHYSSVVLPPTEKQEFIDSYTKPSFNSLSSIPRERRTEGFAFGGTEAANMGVTMISETSYNFVMRRYFKDRRFYALLGKKLPSAFYVFISSISNYALACAVIDVLLDERNLAVHEASFPKDALMSHVRTARDALAGNDLDCAHFVIYQIFEQDVPSIRLYEEYAERSRPPPPGFPVVHSNPFVPPQPTANADEFNKNNPYYTLTCGSEFTKESFAGWDDTKYFYNREDGSSAHVEVPLVRSGVAAVPDVLPHASQKRPADATDASAPPPPKRARSAKHPAAVDEPQSHDGGADHSSLHVQDGEFGDGERSESQDGGYGDDESQYSSVGAADQMSQDQEPASQDAAYHGDGTGDEDRDEHSYQDDEDEREREREQQHQQQMAQRRAAQKQSSSPARARPHAPGAQRSSHDAPRVAPKQAPSGAAMNMVTSAMQTMARAGGAPPSGSNRSSHGKASGASNVAAPSAGRSHGQRGAPNPPTSKRHPSTPVS